MNDLHDLVSLLEKHPEWQAEIRRIVLTKDLLDVPQRLDRLFESHERALERLDRLEETVARLVVSHEQALVRLDRLEQSVAELVEAQKRTEAQLARHEERLARLEEGQIQIWQKLHEHDQRFDRLEKKVDHLGRAVGELTEQFDGRVEDFASDVLCLILYQKGYAFEGAPQNLALNGEIDLVLKVEKDGETVWVVVEVKNRLHARDVEKWAQRIRSDGFRKKLTKLGISGPYLPYVYGQRVEYQASIAARNLGIGVLNTRGELTAPHEPIPSLSGNRSGM